jgi:hypothetical protein
MNNYKMGVEGLPNYTICLFSDAAVYSKRHLQM